MKSGLVPGVREGMSDNKTFAQITQLPFFAKNRAVSNVLTHVCRKVNEWTELRGTLESGGLKVTPVVSLPHGYEGRVEVRFYQGNIAFAITSWISNEKLKSSFVTCTWEPIGRLEALPDPRFEPHHSIETRLEDAIAQALVDILAWVPAFPYRKGL